MLPLSSFRITTAGQGKAFCGLIHLANLPVGDGEIYPITYANFDGRARIPILLHVVFLARPMG